MLKDFQSRWQSRQMLCLPSLTTASKSRKNNHHGELSEASLNRSPLTKDIQKKPHEDGLEGRRHEWADPHSDEWQLKIRSYISARETHHPKEKEVAILHEVPQSRVPMSESEVPTTSGCKSQQRLWMSEMAGCWKPRHTSSKTQAWNYSLIESLTLSSNVGAAAQKAPRT